MIMQSRLLPKMLVEFVEWYGDEHFIATFKGNRILCHKEFWRKVE